MVGQVKVVGILMMVNGGILILAGALLIAMGSLFTAVLPAAPPGGGPPATLFLIIYGVIGAIAAAVGVVNAIAGYRVMTMRSRLFGLIALFSNVGALITFYCAPTAIGMMVYGLIVLFNRDVVDAFEFVRRGGSPDEAVRRFTPRRDDRDYRPSGDGVEDDYDDWAGDSRSRWEENRRRRRAGDEPGSGDNREGPP